MSPDAIAADPAAALAPGLTAIRTSDELVIRLAPGARPEAPLHVVFDAATTRPRLRVEAGRGSALTLVESHHGEGAEADTELVVGEGACVRHARVTRLGAASTHHGRLTVTVAADGAYEAQTIALGGRESTLELAVTLDGEGAEVHLAGLACVTGASSATTRSEVIHAHPHGRSRQVFKAIAGDGALAEFHGRIRVERGAAATDAAQSSRGLLLGTGAAIEARPALLILADDVQCAHGTAIGALDPEALFYLESRGLGRQAAVDALIAAFAAEVIDQVSVSGLRDALGAEITRHLGGKEDA
ncbi:FeS cluster assembly protein SufD [compost metagenome]